MSDSQHFNLIVESPVGSLVLTANHTAVTSLAWHRPEQTFEQQINDVLRDAAQQLEAFFEGTTTFDLPLAPVGSPFQLRGWKAMAEIPWGKTESYGALAARIGSGPRAVGALCATNPLPIIVPCHRVVASNGQLGGFSGGEGPITKQWLLRHEGALEKTLL